jgi:hypothetical protein
MGWFFSRELQAAGAAGTVKEEAAAGDNNG